MLRGSQASETAATTWYAEAMAAQRQAVVALEAEEVVAAEVTCTAAQLRRTSAKRSQPVVGWLPSSLVIILCSCDTLRFSALSVFPLRHMLHSQEGAIIVF